MTSGSGHWRMFLRQHDNNCSHCANGNNAELCPNLKCAFLMGFKDADNQISLCVRGILASQVGQEYRIEIELPSHNAVEFQGTMRAIDEPLGAEIKYDECLTLNSDKVKTMLSLTSSFSSHRAKGDTVMKIYI
jgi:hypothetical protein